MAKTNWQDGELRLERKGADLLLRMGGKLIARRGRPGTRHAHIWISLERRCGARQRVVVDIRKATLQ